MRKDRDAVWNTVLMNLQLRACRPRTRYSTVFLLPIWPETLALFHRVTTSFKESIISPCGVQLPGSVIGIGGLPIIMPPKPWTPSYLWPLVRRYWEPFLTRKEMPRPHPHSPALDSIRPGIILAGWSENYPKPLESARRYQGTIGLAILNRRLPKPSNHRASHGKLENGKWGIAMRSRWMRKPQQKVLTDTTCPRPPKSLNRTRQARTRIANDRCPDFPRLLSILLDSHDIFVAAWPGAIYYRPGTDRVPNSTDHISCSFGTRWGRLVGGSGKSNLSYLLPCFWPQAAHRLGRSEVCTRMRRNGKRSCHASLPGFGAVGANSRFESEDFLCKLVYCVLARCQGPGTWCHSWSFKTGKRRRLLSRSSQCEQSSEDAPCSGAGTTTRIPIEALLCTVPVVLVQYSDYMIAAAVIWCDLTGQASIKQGRYDYWLARPILYFHFHRVFGIR